MIDEGQDGHSFSRERIVRNKTSTFIPDAMNIKDDIQRRCDVACSLTLYCQKMKFSIRLVTQCVRLCDVIMIFGGQLKSMTLDTLSSYRDNLSRLRILFFSIKLNISISNIISELQ